MGCRFWSELESHFIRWILFLYIIVLFYLTLSCRGREVIDVWDGRFSVLFFFLVGQGKKQSILKTLWSSLFVLFAGQTVVGRERKGLPESVFGHDLAIRGNEPMSVYVRSAAITNSLVVRRGHCHSSKITVNRNTCIDSA